MQLQERKQIGLEYPCSQFQITIDSYEKVVRYVSHNWKYLNILVSKLKITSAGAIFIEGSSQSCMGRMVCILMTKRKLCGVGNCISYSFLVTIFGDFTVVLNGVIASLSIVVVSPTIDLLVVALSLRCLVNSRHCPGYECNKRL